MISIFDDTYHDDFGPFRRPMVSRPTFADLVQWLNLQGDAGRASSHWMYQEALAGALEFIESRINLPTGTTDDDYPQLVRTAVLMTAARLAKRSSSPEGTAGFGGDGSVVRIMQVDPDVERLIMRYRRLDGFH